MNNETLDLLEKIEQDYIKNANSLDELLDSNEKTTTIIGTEKAAKLEQSERQLRLEEDKHQLEIAKFEYQKKRDQTDNRLKFFTIVGSIIVGIGGICAGVAKLKQAFDAPKLAIAACKEEGIHLLTSKTARDLVSAVALPKI